jgi:hypothetical protein
VSAVNVTFKYDPEEPDDHPTGMSNAEYERLFDGLVALGAQDVEIERESE